MKKTSLYARKRARRIKTVADLSMERARMLRSVDGVMARCKPFRDNPVFKAADFLLHVEMAFQGLLDGSIPTDDVSTVDVLAQAIDVSKIRLFEISSESNPGIQILELATGAIQRSRDRWQRTGKWGLDGPAMQEIRDAISVYEEVLLASSPMQMHEADGTRVKWIRLQKKGNKNGIVQ